MDNNPCESKMDHYIGCKIIAATPMTRHTFLSMEGKQLIENSEDAHGYLVVYPDGYKSWSPTGVFETAYRKVTTEEIKFLT